MKNGIEMAIEPRDLLTGAEWLVAGGTLMAATLVGIRKMYRVAKNVDSTLTLLDTVHKQLTPNGGNSLYDKVSLSLTMHEATNDDIKDIHKRLNRLEGIAMGKQSAKDEDGQD